jgi:superoxide reductase
MALQFFKCMHCGNVAVKLFDQGPALVCCGEPMQQLVPGSVDAAQEKHVPVVEIAETVKVKVGSVEHPMEADHWITLIALETNRGFQYVELQPGSAPEAEFVLAPNEVAVAAYEYCNKHGLWVTEL